MNNKNFYSTNTLRQQLHDSLKIIPNYQDCILLDRPDYLNLGDHLIWLGCIFYLTNIVKTKINYCSSREKFALDRLKIQDANVPIFFNGGGNLGDLWLDIQKFRENVIQQCPERPIIILPQSIYFQDEINLHQTALIFNCHPDLTIFVRDNYSYEIAINTFDKCQVFKAPDMALEMVNSLKLNLTNNYRSDSILYLCREDRELNQDFNPRQLNLPNLIVEDWLSFSWKLGIRKGILGRYLANIYREGWQRGLKQPQEFLARQKWLNSHPYTAKLKSLDYSELHLGSWSFIHSAIYQFQQHKLIITNRLHGHILCVLLRKPHIFLPNAYHKNEQFYQTWTSNVPFCRFVKDVTKIPIAVEELLNK